MTIAKGKRRRAKGDRQRVLNKIWKMGKYEVGNKLIIREVGYER